MTQTEESSGYRIAFIDLDDTLLGRDKTISADNMRALHRLRNAGIEIAIASGRHHRNIMRVRNLDHAGWVLSSNGSVVRHEQSGEVLAEAFMDRELALHLGARALGLGLCAIIYHGDGAYQEGRSQWTDQYERESGWKPRPGPFSRLGEVGFQKVIWAGDPERIRELAGPMHAEFSDRANVLISNPELLEFFPRTVNKAVGAQALAARLQIDPGRALAFGDGSNDVELLRWAGLSVAMHHGREAAQGAARMVSRPGPRESAFSRAVEQALTFQA